MDASIDVNPIFDVPDPIAGHVYVDQNGRRWRYVDVSYSSRNGTRDFRFASLDTDDPWWICEVTWKQNPMTELQNQPLAPRRLVLDTPDIIDTTGNPYCVAPVTKTLSSAAKIKESK